MNIVLDKIFAIEEIKRGQDHPEAHYHYKFDIVSTDGGRVTVRKPKKVNVEKERDNLLTSIENYKIK